MGMPDLPSEEAPTREVRQGTRDGGQPSGVPDVASSKVFAGPSTPTWARFRGNDCWDGKHVRTYA